MNREELLDLIPAYALGALDKDERAAVEAWLPGDADAQQLLDEYRALADLLPMAAPGVAAPPHLEADLRKRIAARSQPVPKPALTRSWIPALAGIAAALLLVLAGVLLALRPGETPQALYDRLMEQQGAREVAIEPGLQPDTSGELVTSADGRQAVIRVNNLPHINEDQAFQLWLVDETGARSGGIFRFDDPYQDNFIVIPLEKPVTEYRAFGVSLEPASGSPFPDRASGPRVFRVQLSA